LVISSALKWNKDGDFSRYLKGENLRERDVFSLPKTKFNLAAKIRK
jgi:hypothetical protein